MSAFVDEALEERGDIAIGKTTTVADTSAAAGSILTIPSFDPTKIALDASEHPQQWTNVRKWCNVTIIALMGFISPLGSSILVPGLGLMDGHFRLRSRVRALVPVSVFLLGLGIGPFLLAPTSEIRGRYPVFLVSSLIFVALNIGTATVHNYVGLCILRFLAGAAGSTGPSLGAGSIGDMFVPAERGRAQALYGLGPLLGPVCGAIAGGWVTQDLMSWRWQLWILTILSGAIAIIVAFFLRETYAPVLLQNKIARLAQEHLTILEGICATSADDASTLQRQRQEVYTLAYPNRSAEAVHDEEKQLSISRRKQATKACLAILYLAVPGPILRGKLKHALKRPFKLLFSNPICAIFSTYMGFVYGIIFIFITQHPLLYKARTDPDDPPPQRLPTYAWGPGNTSLTYLGLGLGFLLAAAINALVQDIIYNRLVLNGGVLDAGLFKTRATIPQFAAEREARKKEVAHLDADVENTSTLQHDGQVIIAPIVYTKGRPEFRLPLCLLGMFILPCGLLVFGWAGENHTHWAIPLVGSFLVGVGSILPFQAILVYLVDAFIPYSASATACAVFVRAVFAAAFPLFSQDLFLALGFGWGSSLLALVGALAIPVPIILWYKGEGLRKRFKFNG